MRNEQSGLMASVVWHCWRLLSFRGDWKSMPDSSGFAWIAMSATLVGGLTEQLVRGRTLGLAIVSTMVWLGFILAMSRKDGGFNRRLAAALALLSIAIQVLLILSTWIPVVEWPVAIWSGVAVMHLLSQANNSEAGAWR